MSKLNNQRFAATFWQRAYALRKGDSVAELERDIQQHGRLVDDNRHPLDLDDNGYFDFNEDMLSRDPGGFDGPEVKCWDVNGDDKVDVVAVPRAGGGRTFSFVHPDDRRTTAVTDVDKHDRVTGGRAWRVFLNPANRNPLP